MLDIVMVAHKPNYIRMAHRSLNPITEKTESSIRGSLQSAVDRTPLSGKVVLSLEGGRHQDFEAAEAYLSTQNLPWQIIHDAETVSGYYDALMRGLERCTSALVAIVPPWNMILDDLWVQRMSWCLSKDPTALLCTTGEEQGPAKDLAPFVALPRKWPGGQIILGRRVELEQMLRLCNPEDLYLSLAKASAAGSWRIWSHPGLRFETLTHEPHERQKTGRKAKSSAASSPG